MQPHFLPDGPSNLRRSPEYQARLEELHASIRSRYADQLAQAGFLRRMVLLRTIAREFRRERQKLEPSRCSLFYRQPQVSDN